MLQEPNTFGLKFWKNVFLWLELFLRFLPSLVNGLSCSEDSVWELDCVEDDLTLVWCDPGPRICKCIDNAR